jgi:hypothetical protein
MSRSPSEAPRSPVEATKPAPPSGPPPSTEERLRALEAAVERNAARIAALEFESDARDDALDAEVRATRSRLDAMRDAARRRRGRGIRGA